jgi:mono/diheme cytochrome c family protein
MNRPLPLNTVFQTAASVLAWIVVPLFVLMASSCTDMYDQPSFKAQESPRLLPAEGSVPISGAETIEWGTAIETPRARTRSSIAHGEELYAINCAMCHGTTGKGDGAVGRKFVPPPPALLDDRIQGLSDGDIFKRIALGFGRMPSFRKRLSPEDRWDVVNFVKELRHEQAGGGTK